jgi:LysM repeat protein
MKEVPNDITVSSLPDDKGPQFVFDSLVTYINSGNSTQLTSPIVACNEKPFSGFHKIQSGETIYRLSKKYNTTVSQIMNWNKLNKTSDIKICSHLRVEAPKKEKKKIVLVTPRVKRGPSLDKRIVKKGETIYTIAEDYRISPAELRKANTIKNNEVKTGQLLNIPSSKNINISKIEAVKGINYFTQSSPWLDFWTDFDMKIIRRDLSMVKNLRMNTIRVFVPSDGVVVGLQHKVILDKLELLLDECLVMDIDVIVTLFDFPVSFDLSYYPKSDRQLENLLTRFKDHEALLAYDLKNEPDLDFERIGKMKVMQWLNFLIERAREYDPNHLLTIGWSNPEDAILLSEKLDFVSYHYYRDPKKLTLDMLNLKKAVNKPLLLGEFGIPSNRKWYYPIGTSQQEQSEYLKEMKREMEINGLPYLLWTLHDFNEIPTEVFGYKKWTHNKQKYFGLLDRNGKKKPAYYIFAPHEKR